MTRMKRWQKIVIGTLAGIVAIIAIIIFIFTQTDFGRSRIRAYGLAHLAASIHGIVRIGKVHGNLLTGARIDDVLITDSLGHPFLRADTLEIHYSLHSLYEKRIYLHDVRIVHPIIVVDADPITGVWNYQRLFPTDSTNQNDSIPAFGDWVRFDRLTVVRGDITVRRQWAPAATMSPHERAALIERALKPNYRDWIVRSGQGFQALATFTDVNGYLPLVIFADPDSSARVIDVARMSTHAKLFRAPPADVRNLTGHFVVGADTAFFRNATLTLPASKFATSGWYSILSTNMNARVHAAPVNFGDIRWANESLPDGGGSLDIAIGRIGSRTRIVATNVDVRAEGSHVQGAIDLQTGPLNKINSSNIAFDGVDTRLIHRMSPSTHLPVEGVLEGHMRLAGASNAMSLDGWTNIRDRGGDVSRITANGTIGNRPGGMVARNLQLRFNPIRVSLLRSARPDLPIGGIITGRATLNGNLSSRFNIDADVVHDDRATGRSHVVAVGDLSAHGDFTTRSMRMRFEPVQAALLRAFQPSLDLSGEITGRATLAGGLIAGFNVDADVVHTSRETGRSHVLAKGAIIAHNGFKARHLHLTFDPLQVALIKSFQPSLKLAGTISGNATLTGAMNTGFVIDADIVHNDTKTGRSHVLAVGEVGLSNGFVAKNLKLRFEPLQVALLKTFRPTLPIDGVISGTTTLNGSPSRRIAAVMDVTHTGSTGTSQLAGDATVSFASGAVQQVDVNLSARPLSLATAGLFAPSAGLRGSVTGSIVARGVRDNITFTSDLATTDGGAIAARGTLALGNPLHYDITSQLNNFNPSIISSRAPVGILTGKVIANGHGTDLATADATVDVALVDSRIPGTPRTDSTRLVAHIANGLATIDQGRIRLASAIADISGTFGLVASQTGTLKYDVMIDTLSRVADFAKGDTSMIFPRPAQQARRFAMARADSARIALATEVERAATGKPPAPTLVLDTINAIPADSVAGSVHAQGTLAGNIRQFDAVGTASLRDVLFHGSQVQRGDLSYNITNAPSAQMGANINANLVGVRTNGFGFDSAHVVVNDTGGFKEGTGNFDLALFQDPARDYRIKSDFTLALDRKELRLADLQLRFDSTLWRGTQPGAVTWASSGIGLRTIDLRNDRGGHIYADGTLPKEGSGDLQLAIDSLQVGDIAALIQDTMNTRGILTLHTHLQGSAASPVMSGTIILDSATRGGTRIPDLHGNFNYANRQLVADAQLTRGVQILMNAKATLPIDLALTGRTPGEPRLLDAPLSVDAHMDSLSLDALPTFTNAVQDVRGVVRGDVTVRGTYKEPQLAGRADLTVASARIVDPGIILTDGVGSFSFKDRQVVVDSLVARSGGGPVRLTGSIDASTLTRPAFDLKIAATNAQVVNSNRWGNLKADVAVNVKGPYDQVNVTGNVHVRSGIVNAPEQGNTRRATNLDDPTYANVLDTLDAPPQFRASRNTILRNMQMDVGVQIDRDTWARNSTANVEIYTEESGQGLHVRADNAHQVLILDGTLNADRGDYTVAGRQFKLTTGSATFLGTPVIDPMLQLSAQYDVPRRGNESLTILINVGGYLHSPRLTLSSNAQPPLPQSDLISYLAFGRTSSSLLSPEASGLSGSDLGFIAQQQLAALGLGAFTDVLVRSVQDQGTRAGLDVFRIHPGTLPDELSFGNYFQNMLNSTEFEAGKYINKRLFAAVQGRASGSIPGARLEYETRGGFSWRATLEPRYRPIQPSFIEISPNTKGKQINVLGTFFFWTRRY